MGEIVPFKTESLPILNIRAIGEGVRLVLSHTLLGFIVDGEDNYDPFFAHEQVVDDVRYVTKQVHPHKTISCPQNPLRTTELASDILHSNVAEGPGGALFPTFRTGLQVWTAGVQTANIALAKLGSDPNKAVQFANVQRGRTAASAPTDPHQLFLQGMVDPELTEPRVYCGQLAPSDSLVIANAGLASPWHRFEAADGTGELHLYLQHIEESQSGIPPTTYGLDIAAPAEQQKSA